MTLLFLLITFWFGVPATPGTWPSQRFPANYPIHSKRIRFPPGRSAMSIRGVARTPGIYEYVVRAKAGQYMSLHLTSSNNGVELSIFGPKAENPSPALGVQDWEGELNDSGDYKITLINNRTRMARNPSYELQLSIR